MKNQKVFLKDYKIPNYLIDTIDLTFELNENETIVKNIMQIRKNPESSDANTLLLKADELELISVHLDDKELTDFEFNEKDFTLNNAPDNFKLSVITKIHPEENTQLMGLYKSNGMYCSQCEAEGFRRITLHPDRPDVMSEFTTTIIADKKSYPIMLSNGNKVEEYDLQDNKHLVKWHDPFKKPGHLFAIVAGDLDYIADTFTTMSNKVVDLKVFTDKKNIHKAGFAMNCLKSAMKWDEQTYGREYDLDNFMIVAVDAFNMGAMENKGLNIFNSSAVLSTPETTNDKMLEYIQKVVGHEYFHNWSGNRIGCRDWFQLSLKEGFTVFRDARFSEDLTEGSRKVIDDAITLRALQFAEDSSPMSHPVQPQEYEEIDNFYTLTVYEKGAEVVRMYQTLLGKQGFRKGTDLYFKTFDGQAATIEDFRWAMEQANEVDLTQFHNWYTQNGTPIVKVTENYDPEEQNYSITLQQVIQKDQQPFLIPLKFGLVDKNGNDLDLDDMLVLTQMEETYTFGNIAEKPVLSILRNFSAPVKIDFDQSIEDIKFLAANDNDSFNRYDAIERIMMNEIKNAINDLKDGYSVCVSKDLIDVFESTLNDDNINIEVLAEYLKLPAFQLVFEHVQPIDPVLTNKALKQIQKIIATEFQEEFSVLFNKYYNTHKAYEFSRDGINSRAITNVALSYLIKADEQQYTPIVQNIFESADNMTLHGAAFSMLINTDNKIVRDNAFAEFYERWHDDNLVIDSWIMQKAGSEKDCDIQSAKELLNHEKFDINNPNKVRAFVSGLVSNPNYHCQQGYKLLTDLILKLDKSNPNIAARIVSRLISFNKYDEKYSTLMKQQVEYIAKNAMSAGVLEIVNKAL